MKIHATPHIRTFVIALTAVCLCAWAVADAYRLAPEDVISIQVLYHPELSVGAATVRPDGMINYPLAGDIKAAGRTPVELSEIIAGALREELRAPKVSVRLVSRYVAPVYVLGAVRLPGAAPVTGPVTVAEAVALAGGLLETAAPRFGTLIHADGSQSQVDVMTALAGDDPVAILAPGDTLVVSAQFLVSVVGEVKLPGRYPAEQGDLVADALAVAGGLGNRADGSRARLVRGDGTSLPVDLDAIIADADVAENLPLAPGDLLVVPTREQRVTVVGAVQLPGKYDFDEGDRISDALAQARGPLEDARLTEVVLVRRDGAALPVDLEAIVQDGEQMGNLILEHGDTLIVPRWADQVAVMGLVDRPGPLLLEDGMTVMQAIAAAGGWVKQDAAPARTLLWRQQGSEPTIIAVDALALVRGGENVEDITLMAGDIIYVPGKHAMSTADVSRIIVGLSAVLRLVL